MYMMCVCVRVCWRKKLFSVYYRFVGVGAHGSLVQLHPSLFFRGGGERERKFSGKCFLVRYTIVHSIRTHKPTHIVHAYPPHTMGMRCSPIVVNKVVCRFVPHLSNTDPCTYTKTLPIDTIAVADSNVRTNEIYTQTNIRLQPN